MFVSTGGEYETCWGVPGGSVEHAKKLVRYFERIARDYPRETWDKALATARNWLRLAKTGDASSAEMAALLGVAHGNRFRSSGWYDLAGGVYQWVRSRGLSVPPPQVFFAPEGVAFSPRRGSLSPMQYAEVLLATFKQYHEEDPMYEAWTAGIDAMQEWVDLLESTKVERDKLSTLVQNVVDCGNRFPSMQWFDAAIGVWTWCIALGYPDIVPENELAWLNRDAPEKWHHDNGSRPTSR